MEQLVWHGEVEISLDKCRPLFATIIYDSCRDQLPQSVRHLVKESSREHEPILSGSNFCIGYGTRQSMRSFVKMDNKSGLSQSLYTKYLLQHISTKNISISTMFEKLNCSFTMNEDASIVAQMKPEFKDSTRQSFCLSAPLRHGSASLQHQKFFEMCRFEALPSCSQDFSAEISYQLGLAWSAETEGPKWIQGKTYQEPEVMMKLTISASIFLNEAVLKLFVKSGPVHWLKESSFHVMALNVKLSKESNPHAQKSGLEGISYPLDQVPISDDYQPLATCQVSNLQRVQDSVLKFRASLLYRGCPIQCKGVINVPVPLCQNIPNLKLSNAIN